MFEWQHVKNQNSTYFRHARKSLLMGLYSLRGFFCSIVHAVYPDVLETWTDDMIKDIFERKGSDPRKFLKD